MNKDIKKYLKIVKSKFNLSKALLFGSRARGDYLFDSDVDMILVSEDFEKITFRKRMGELLDGWTAEVDLEVIGYTPEEFLRMQKRMGIVQQAVKEGKDLL